ncbi:hypothetical protein OPS25_14165 [Alteromonas ponticola]|uniref:PEP-CTERM sorting domain-containing protein n=1 Tax=Alteromonas aquimaris TaxID=2998417 RepID=A0ABT3PC03_9ALTE|nr:hypothetical protein [Alteromonas aquimaris]MCW8109651.1 hypothetical protein [Alteromonas aquimaris]
MKRLFAAVFAICISGVSSAAVIPVDTKNWSYELSPSSNRISTKDGWTRLLSNTPTKLSNSSGSLISDFSINSDFVFSGKFSPTYASNSACATPDEGSCNDDDILGIVFGWQDADNHYRLGWSQGGVSDITGKSGLFLVKEEGGVSNTVMNWANLFWVDEALYSFSLTREGSSFALTLTGTTQNVQGDQSAQTPSSQNPELTESAVNFNFDDLLFAGGNVGVYTESQTAVFSALSVITPAEVFAPATAWLLLASLVRLKKRKV